MGNGWYEIGFTQSNTAASIRRFHIGFSTVATGGGEDLQYSGTGSKLLIALPQFELGAFATSPIETEDTAVTRLADVVTVDDLSGWYNPVEGTFVVDFNDATAVEGTRQFSLYDAATGGGSSGSLFSTRASSGFYGAIYRRASDGIGLAVSTSVPQSVGKHKVAIRLINGVLSVSFDGAAIASTTDAPGLGFDVMSVGSFINGSWLSSDFNIVSI